MDDKLFSVETQMDEYNPKQKKKIHKKTFCLSPMADFFFIFVLRKARATTVANLIKIWRSILGKSAELSIIPAETGRPTYQKGGDAGRYTPDR